MKRGARDLGGGACTAGEAGRTRGTMAVEAKERKGKLSVLWLEYLKQ